MSPLSEVLQADAGPIRIDALATNNKTRFIALDTGLGSSPEVQIRRPTLAMPPRPKGGPARERGKIDHI